MSSIFVIPILILIYSVCSGIFTNIVSLVYLDRWWKFAIVIILAAVGACLVLISDFGIHSLGWVILLFGLSPLFGAFLRGLNIPVQREGIALLAVFFAGASIAYGEGHGSFRARSCFTQLLVTIGECEKCYFIKAYSEFIIVKHPSRDGIQIHPNTHTYSLIPAQVDYLSKQDDPYCNPIGTMFQFSRDRGSSTSSL